MTIKHLVISGGGPSGFYAYGAAKYLSNHKFWNIENIETIYGTSIGAYLGTILCLKYDWDTLDDYIIKRPLNKIFNVSPEAFFRIWETKGIFGEECMRETLKPLLIAKELNIDITLKEFYDYSKIELHMFSVDINDFPLRETDISYKTHPDLTLITALTMTTSIPFIFKPVILNDKCFLDGGIVINYPLNICLSQTKCNENEILAFKNYYSTETNIRSYNINDNTTLMTFWLSFMRLLIKQLNKDSVQPTISNEVKCLVDDIGDVDEWKKCLNEKEQREKFVKKGEAAGFMFYQYKSSLKGQ
jgi:predicted acylesterase/phospholipase RssA